MLEEHHQFRYLKWLSWCSLCMLSSYILPSEVKLWVKVFIIVYAGSCVSGAHGDRPVRPDHLQPSRADVWHGTRRAGRIPSLPAMCLLTVRLQTCLRKLDTHQGHDRIKGMALVSSKFVRLSHFSWREIHLPAYFSCVCLVGQNMFTSEQNDATGALIIDFTKTQKQWTSWLLHTVEKWKD